MVTSQRYGIAIYSGFIMMGMIAPIFQMKAGNVTVQVSFEGEVV